MRDVENVVKIQYLRESDTEGLKIPKESALVPMGNGDLFRNLKQGNKISRFVLNKEH